MNLLELMRVMRLYGDNAKLEKGMKKLAEEVGVPPYIIQEALDSDAQLTIYQP